MVIDWTTGAIQQVPTARSWNLWNWSGISAATVVVVTGPFRVSATQAHISGGDAGQAHVSGVDVTQVHIAGADAAQTKSE